MKKIWKKLVCTLLAVSLLLVYPAQTAKADSGTIEDFVTRLYTLCLNRTPDEDGLNDWCTLLSDGSYTGTQVAHGFVFSDEFIASGYSDEEFVQQMYRIFLGREYDREGMETWLGLMQNSGYGREAIFNGFSQSVEFGNICTDYGIEQGGAVGKVADDISSFVIRFYQVFLGRGADPSGLQTWTTELKNKTMSAAEVAQGFVFSDEFLGKNFDDATFVKYMYTAFLDRGADEEGLKTWTDCLKNGWTREQVFEGFVDSNEFARICDEYGIECDDETVVPGPTATPDPTPTPKPTLTPEEPYEFLSGDYITTEDIELDMESVVYRIGSDIYVPGNLEEVTKTVMSVMEELGGLTFEGNKETQQYFADTRILVNVTKNYLYRDREGYVGAPRNEFGAAGAYGYEIEMSPAELLLGNSNTLVHELGHILKNRQSRWLHSQLLEEGFAEYITYLTMQELEDNAQEVAVYLDKSTQNIIDMEIYDYTELYKQPVEYWFEHVFEYSGNANYTVGFRFMAYLHDVYGNYSEWIPRFEETYPFIPEEQDGYSSTAERQIEILKDVYGEDVLDNFYPWLKEHQDDFVPHYTEIIDRSEAEKVNLYPLYNGIEEKMALTYMEYNDLYVNLEPARKYLTEYKKVDASDLKLVTDAPIKVNLYHSDGSYVQKVTDEPISLDEISYIKLVGEGKIDRLEIIGFSDFVQE